jgi:Phage integrase family
MDVERLSKALAAGSHGERDELMMNTAAYSGLRWGEIIALTIGQVDQGKRVIAVDRKVVEISGRQYSEAPKKRKVRRTIYPRRTPSGYLLAEKLAARAEEARAEQQAGTNPLGLLFPAPMGKVWRASNFNRNVLARAYRTAGWRDEVGKGRWVWHSLRHVFCTTRAHAHARSRAASRAARIAFSARFSSAARAVTSRDTTGSEATGSREFRLLPQHRDVGQAAPAQRERGSQVRDDLARVVDRPRRPREGEQLGETPTLRSRPGSRCPSLLRLLPDRCADGRWEAVGAPEHAAPVPLNSRVFVVGARSPRDITMFASTSLLRDPRRVMVQM